MDVDYEKMRQAIKDGPDADVLNLAQLETLAEKAVTEYPVLLKDALDTVLTKRSIVESQLAIARHNGSEWGVARHVQGLADIEQNALPVKMMSAWNAEWIMAKLRSMGHVPETMTVGQLLETYPYYLYDE